MKTCALCGSPIPLERDKRNRAKYCSLACSRKAQRIARGEYTSKRVNGVRPFLYDAYIRYGSKCAICGWQAFKIESHLDLNQGGKVYLSGGCELHHIKPVNEGGEEAADNLILLCPNHHKQADMGLIPIEELERHVVLEVKLTAGQRRDMVSRSVDRVASAIFG